MMASSSLTWVWMALSSVVTVDGMAADRVISLDPTRVGWHELEYQASKLGMTATSTIRLASVDRDQARAALLAVDGVSLPMPSAPMVASVTIETVLRKRHSTIEAWFDWDTGKAYQRGKLETGRKYYQRTDRLGDGTVYRRRRAPVDDSEITTGPEGWNHRENEDVALPNVPADAIVTVPSALFYWVAAAPLEKEGDRLSLYAFSRQSIDRLELEVLGRASVTVDFTGQVTGKGAGAAATDARTGTIDALCVAVRAESLAADDSDASFQFLGLKGDVEIFLDPETRLPLQVSGSTGILGRLDVKLRRVVWAER